MPEKGEFMAFALRLDTRKAPAPVLKLHLQEALLQEEEKLRAEGRTAVPRARKKELKELITARLLSRVEPSPLVVDAAVDMTNGLVYVGSASKGILERFQEYAEKSFGEAPVLLPHSLMKKETDAEEKALEAASRVMRSIYDQEQTVEFEDRTYSVHLSDSVSVALAAVDSPVSINSKGTPESVNTALGEGLQIVKLHIEVEEAGSPDNTFSFTWNNTFAFSGLKLPVVATDKDDPDGAFLGKMYLTSRVVGVMSKLLTNRDAHGAHPVSQAEGRLCAPSLREGH